ncbi:MAG: protein rep [Hyphomicrobiaceae bacterium]|nr:protein rep [Hyphomicrobiaceae bacterium]
MTSPAKRAAQRFRRMLDTDKAIIAAHFALARRETDPSRATFYAARGYAMQTCYRTTRIVVHEPDDDAPYTTMHTARQCRSRTCQVCQRIHARQTRRLHHALLERIWRHTPEMRISLLTLSMRNRPLAEAKPALEDFTGAVRRYYALKEVKRSHHGVLIGVEAAIRGDDANPMIGWHAHCAQLITDACMVEGRYLAIMRIRELFRDCLRVDYLPQCWIAASKPDPDGDTRQPDRNSTTEAVKYCCKPVSYLSANPPKDLFGAADAPRFHVSPDVVRYLTEALHNRQLVTMKGAWAKARKEHCAEQRTAKRNRRSPSSPDPFQSDEFDGLPF